jgi:hypothetical protein
VAAAQSLPAPADAPAADASTAVAPKTAAPAAEPAPAKVAEDHDGLSDELSRRITLVEQAIEELRQLFRSRPAAVRAAARPVERAVAQPAKPTQPPPAASSVPPPPQYHGRLLSVDLWDGKPSAVVSTGDPADARVRVMQPGDTLNGITLREVNLQERSASFDMGDGRIVTLGGEER